MKGKFTSVILAVVLVAITAGTIFFGYSKASGKITKSGAEEEQRDTHGHLQPVVQKIRSHTSSQHSLQKK